MQPFLEWKSSSTTYYECVFVAAAIQHAECMRHIILSSVASLTLPHFSTVSRKWHDFREKVIEHKICVLIFSTNLAWTFVIIRLIQRDTVTNAHRSSCKVVAILLRF